MSAREHEHLRLAVDLVILTVRANALHVLLIRRGNTPYRGQLALPGGFIRKGEDLLAAAMRELAEETGLDVSRLRLQQLALQQLGAYGAPDRDPRGRVVSVAYLAIAPNLPIPVAGSDAASARWEPVASGLWKPAGTRQPATTDAARQERWLAFDHDQILTDAVERARQMLEYTTIAAAFCDDQFTIGELRHVYEVIWGIPLDPRNFNRKVTNTEGFAVPTGERRAQETGRPAALYRRGPATTLYPQMLRPKPEGNGAAQSR